MKGSLLPFLYLGMFWKQESIEKNLLRLCLSLGYLFEIE